jgi:hypothetical protein
MYEELRNWYIEYGRDEFDTPEDDSASWFDHAYETGEELGVMYTTFDAEDGEHSIQVSITLSPAEERVYVDNERVYNHRFESMSDLYDSFKGCTFDDIYGWALMYHARKEVC